MVNCIVVLSM